jgi:hypothetical protein
MRRKRRRHYLPNVMSHEGQAKHDLGRCGACGGRIAATHMLTGTYEVDEHGRWQRRLDEFVEDVVVVCTICGEEPVGRFDADAGMFAFVPEDAHRTQERGSD